MPEDKKFIPSDNLVVGHQGLYDPSLQPPDEDDDTLEQYKTVSSIEATLSTISETILANIPLGRKQEGKVVLSVESNIKKFVADCLANEKNPKTKEPNENYIGHDLPDTETGVWVHYLTEGIKRDFGRTWEDEPVSIRPKLSSEAKKASSGARIITKQEKNELLAQLDWKYYEPKVNSGVMTMEEAMSKFQEKVMRKKELEDMGVNMSPQKTLGVGFFDGEKAVVESYKGNWSALDFYGKNKVKLLVPDLLDNIFQSTTAPSKKLITECIKCSKLKGALLEKMRSVGCKHKEIWDSKTGKWKKGIIQTEGEEQYGGLDVIKIRTLDDLMLEYANLFKKIKEDCPKNDIRGIHLAKSVFSKTPHIIVDLIDKENNIRYIYWEDGSMTGKFQDDVWYGKQFNGLDYATASETFSNRI